MGESINIKYEPKLEPAFISGGLFEDVDRLDERIKELNVKVLLNRKVLRELKRAQWRNAHRRK